jgi:predicted Zn-dependent protease with MMP-like domain
MDYARFEQLVLDTLESLPPEFVPFLENVEIIIEPRLTRDIRQRYDLEPDDVVYGLYEGVPLPERSGDDITLPDMIILFQAPLEQDFPDEHELREEVRRTVLHELAHHLGISDERLEELGAY